MGQRGGGPFGWDQLSSTPDKKFVRIFETSSEINPHDKHYNILIMLQQRKGWLIESKTYDKVKA